MTLCINRKCQRESRKRAEIGECCYTQSTVRIYIYIYIWWGLSLGQLLLCVCMPLNPTGDLERHHRAAELYHRFGVQLYQMFPGAACNISVKAESQLAPQSVARIVLPSFPPLRLKRIHRKQQANSTTHTHSTHTSLSLDDRTRQSFYMGSSISEVGNKKAGLLEPHRQLTLTTSIFKIIV